VTGAQIKPRSHRRGRSARGSAERARAVTQIWREVDFVRPIDPD